MAEGGDAAEQRCDGSRGVWVAHRLMRSTMDGEHEHEGRSGVCPRRCEA